MQYLSLAIGDVCPRRDPAIEAGSLGARCYSWRRIAERCCSYRRYNSDNGGSVERKRSHHVVVGEARCILEVTELSRSGSMADSVTEVLILSRTMRQGKLAM